MGTSTSSKTEGMSGSSEIPVCWNPTKFFRLNILSTVNYIPWWTSFLKLELLFYTEDLCVPALQRGGSEVMAEDTHDAKTSWRHCRVHMCVFV